MTVMVIVSVSGVVSVALRPGCPAVVTSKSMSSESASVMTPVQVDREQRCAVQVRVGPLVVMDQLTLSSPVLSTSTTVAPLAVVSPMLAEVSVTVGATSD